MELLESVGGIIGGAEFDGLAVFGAHAFAVDVVDVICGQSVEREVNGETVGCDFGTRHFDGLVAVFGFIDVGILNLAAGDDVSGQFGRDGGVDRPN